MTGLPCGLDFAAVMGLAHAQGADVELIADVLPDFETAMLAAMAGDGEDE